MRARLFSRALALAVAACALALYSSQLPPAVARSDRPWCEHCNIILISFDTVRADHLGVYGYGRDTSPNIDRFAQNAVVFDEAISQAAWTLPAHGSIFSGLYPGRLGVLHYPAMHRLPDDNPVLATELRKAGYATGGFTGGGFVSDHYGFDRGFDVYSTSGRHFEDNFDQAVAWLRTNSDHPFFLFLHGYDAHRPYYSKPSDKKEMGLPAGSPSEQGRYCIGSNRARPDAPELDEIVRYYDASIHHGDRTLGVFLRALDHLDLMDNTVILLTSDHGEEFFEHGNCDHVRFLYRESVHVPLVLYVPHMTRGTRHIAGLVPASISIARTLLDIVGVDHSMPGVTLLPVINGTQRDFPVVYSEAESDPGVLGSRGDCRAMTRPNQKLISYADEGSDEGFDLKNDRLETKVLPERSEVYFLRSTLRAFADAQTPLQAEARDVDLTPEELGETSGGFGSGVAAPGSAGAAGSDSAAAPEGAGPAGGGAGAVPAGRDAVPDAAGAGSAGGGVAAPDAAGRGGAARGSGPGDRKAAAKRAPRKNDAKDVPDDVKESLRSLGYLE